jgi:hypothetical protein
MRGDGEVESPPPPLLVVSTMMRSVAFAVEIAAALAGPRANADDRQF